MATTKAQKGKGTDNVTTAAKSAPLDLSKATQIDGALPTPRTIDDLLGIYRCPYSTRDFDVYRRQLYGMQLYQLQSHAQKLGILPGQNRDVCIQRLEEAFVKWKNRYQRTIAANKEPETQEDERVAKIRERAEQVLRRGRV